MNLKSTPDIAESTSRSIRSAACLSCLLVCGCQTASAQRKGASIAPSQFIGKSIEECERTLGKPGYAAGVGTGNYKNHGNMAQSRYYKVPGVTRIVLIRTVRNGESRKNDPDKRTLNSEVSAVQYQIPGTRVKNWKEALNLIGASSKGVSEGEKFSTGFVSLAGFPGGYEVTWTPAGAHDGPSERYFVKDKANHLLHFSKAGS